MYSHYVVYPKLTEHCMSTVIEKMLLNKLLKSMKCIIQINVLILEKKKKSVAWNCLIFFYKVKLLYKQEAKWYGAHGFSNS